VSRQSESRATRHLAPDTLDALWDGGVPVVLPIPGTRPCQVRIDPQRSEIALTTNYERPEPDVARLMNVSFDPYIEHGAERAQITAVVVGSPRGAYTLIVAIVDGIQLEDQPLSLAVARAVEQHKDLLAPRDRLTEEAEVGLFGELLFLDHLVTEVDVAAAIASWLGPVLEEHDFVLSTTGVEVKTTAGERRRHFIHGLTQLVPTEPLPLHLVSIQITRSTTAAGRTLPQLVEHLRQRVGAHREALDGRLRAAGWDDSADDLYATRWVLRSAPRAYLVDNDFPAMTPDHIELAIPNFGLIDDVSYRVDVTALRHVSGPRTVSGFVEHNESEPA